LIEKFLDFSHSLLEEEINQNLEWQWFSDEENLEREYKKLEWKFDDRKIVEKLIRKGFMYDDVKNIVFK
jgi:SOS response regulatory protein OraA/RecX